MKSKLVIFVALYALSFTSKAQWNQENNHLKTTQNVSIGNSWDPWANLVVYDDNFARTVLYSPSTASNGSLMQIINGDGTERNLVFGVVSPNLSAPWIGYPNTKSALLVAQGSDVEALIFGTRSNSPIVIGTSDIERMRITTDGNIGIGTDDPKSKLAVNGVIRSTEINVMADITVPDYVFEPEYELPGLEKVRDFVNTHKHLPEIPNAAQIEKEGIDLGEMNMRLLKKIEELTLYQIQLMDEVKTLRGKIESIENERNP